MKQLLLSSIFIFWTSLLFAQTNFQPGYVVTTSGDTLWGEVASRGAQRNARLARFRASAATEAKEYFPGQLRGYGFTGDQVYETGIVTLADSGRTASLVDAVMDSVRGPRFLEVLVQGPASLLYLRDLAEKDHYYVRIQADGPVRELISKTSVSNVNGVNYQQNSNEYKFTLASAMQACLAVQPAIAKAKFAEAEFIRLVQLYNKCVGAPEEANAVLGRKTQFSPAIVVGGQQNRFEYYQPGKASGTSAYGTQAATTLNPVVGLALRVTPARINPNLELNFKVLYIHQTFSAEYDAKTGYGNLREQFKLNTTSLYFPGLVSYTFMKGKVRPFIQAGYTIMVLLQADGEYRNRYTTGSFARDEYQEEGYITSGKETLGGVIVAGAGLRIKRSATKNINLELIYADRTDVYNAGYGKSKGQLNLLLGYELGK
jgi:hypothetical protein